MIQFNTQEQINKYPQYINQMVSQNTTPLMIFLTLSIAATIAVNSIYRHELYAMGVEIIVILQSHSNVFLDWFFMIITMSIDPAFVFTGIIAMVVFSQKKGKGLIILCFILINTFFAALIKAYHCDPRPIWTRDQVRNIGFYCPVQYGNPSGHSWFSVIAGFGILMQYRGVGKNYRNIVFSILLIILVPISRMYLGAHSLNQVLEGLIFGIFFCLLYVMGLKNIIHKFLTEFNHNKLCKVFIITLHLLSIIAYIKHFDQQLPQNWLKNISRKCFKDMNQAKLNQLMLTVNSMIINILTGIAMGYEQLMKSHIGAAYLTGCWVINHEKYGKVFAHLYFVLVEVAVLLSGLVIGGIIYKINPSFATGYVSLSVGGLVSGYALVTRTAKYLQKLEIIKPSTKEKKQKNSQKQVSKNK